MLQSLSYNIFGDLSPTTLQARRTFPHAAGSAGPALRVGSHAFPSGIVGLILVLRLHLFRDAVEHFVGLLLIEFFLFVFFHVITYNPIILESDWIFLSPRFYWVIQSLSDIFTLALWICTYLFTALTVPR